MSADVAQWVALAASAVALTFAVRANRLSAAYADEAEAHADRAEAELRWLEEHYAATGAARQTPDRPAS